MEQQQIDPRIVARYIMEYQSQQDNFMRFQIDTEEELNRLRIDLLGLEYDEELEEYVRSNKKDAQINEKGADLILTLMRSRISKISSLSDLDDNEINRRCRFFADDITYSLTRHKDEYEIKSLQILHSIINLCDDIFFTTLKKARNAGERDSLRKSYTHVESSENVTQTQTKPRLFINPFSTKKPVGGTM